MPDLAPLGMTPADAPADQALLAVLIDAEQRPSRRALPFPVSRLKGEAEKARASWGAGALPWLILTDKAPRSCRRLRAGRVGRLRQSPCQINSGLSHSHPLEIFASLAGIQVEMPAQLLHNCN